MANGSGGDLSTPPPAKQYRYQQSKSVEDLYLAKKCCDVYFTFGLNQGAATRIPAHTNLLGADSDVFERMFYNGGTKKFNVSRVRNVATSEAAFKEFLQFFYLSDVQISAEHIADIIRLGHKYKVQTCIDACVKFLKNDLTDENVCTALSLGFLCDQNELVKMCEMRIKTNTAAVLASEGFLKCTKRVLAQILCMNVLSCSEVDVFKACMSWVKFKCRETVLTKSMVDVHLDRLYYQIRFTSMTIQEFCQLSSEYSSVLSSDYETITKMIVMPNYKPDDFNPRPRCPIWNSNTMLTCERRVKCGPNQKLILNTQEMTTFSTNAPILLGGFACANKIDVVTGAGINESSIHDLRSDLLLEIVLKEARDLNGANGKVLLKMNTRFGSTERMILLTRPILIRPGFWYTICTGPFPKQHLVCSKMLKAKVRMGSEIVVEFHKNGHLVEELISTLYFNRI